MEGINLPHGHLKTLTALCEWSKMHCCRWQWWDDGADVNRGKRDDIEEEDDQESYFRYMEENPMAGVINDDDDNIDYDEDGNAIIPDKKVLFVALIVTHRY